MKELASHLRKDSEISVEIKKPIEKKTVFIGSLVVHKGQTVYQMNLSNKNIDPVVYDEVTFISNGEKRGVHKKIMRKENHIYTVAINQKNAERKFLKYLK